MAFEMKNLREENRTWAEENIKKCTLHKWQPYRDILPSYPVHSVLEEGEEMLEWHVDPPEAAEHEGEVVMCSEVSPKEPPSACPTFDEPPS